MATGAVYPGEHCEKIGLTIDMFKDESQTLMISNIPKGAVFELSLLRRACNTPWIQFYERVKGICDATFAVSFNSFKVMIGRLEKKKAELFRNKQRGQLETLFQEPFCPASPPTASSLAPVDALAKEKARNKELSEKLNKLSTRNVNKRLKRRDVKLAESRELVKEMSKEIQDQDRTINKLEKQLHTAHTSSNCLRQKLYRSNSKIEANDVENSELATQMEAMESEFTEKITDLEKKLELLITEVELARHERDVLSERLDEIQSSAVQTKHGQKFIDGVRQCCMDLLSMNVGTCQVEPVIRSVLRNIASIECGALPKPSTLSGMLAEMKCLAFQQISDELS